MTTETNRPTHIAWHVQERGKTSHWTRIGAAWAHRDGQGMNIRLECLPLTGELVLRVPKDSDDPQPRNQDRGARR